MQAKNILITRPSEQALSLAQELHKLGYKPHIAPTLEIETLLAPEKTAELAALVDYDLAIFVSQNAVNATAELLKYFALPMPSNLSIAAVGPTTAEACQEQAWQVDLLPEQEYNSEGLLALERLQRVDSQKVAIFCAAGGRQLLQTTLQQRGANVKQFYVYKRVCPSESTSTIMGLLQAEQIDLILSHSAESLRNLIRILEPIYMDTAYTDKVQQIPLMVISPRMADLAKKIGFLGRILLADNATDTAVIAKINAIYREGQNERK